MFEKYEYLGLKYETKNKQYIYSYKITDSDFVCESSATISTPMRATKEAKMRCNKYAIYSAFINEYANRKLDIVRNLFLLNNDVIKTVYYWEICTDGKRLKSHLKDINKYIDYYFPQIEFSKKYYDDLIKYTKKMMILA